MKQATSKPAKGVAGRSSSLISNKVVSQKTGGTGGSAPQSTATGSGSRPTASRFKIDSSNPSSSQKIRPSNTTEGTSYKS